LICGEISTARDSTISVNAGLLELCDASFVDDIRRCANENDKSILLTHKPEYPFLVIGVEIVDGKLILNFGIIYGELAGHGVYYSLDRSDGSFHIGKCEGLWKS
jgi:hypothetical protein